MADFRYPSQIPTSGRALALTDYAEVMAEIAWRWDAGRGFLRGTPSRASVEAAAVQLRAALELILYSSLLAHSELLGKAQEAFARCDVKTARALVRKTNPHWWPLPNLEGAGELTWAPRETALSEAQWGPLYGYTSDLLHAANPIARASLVPWANAERLLDAFDRLEDLLKWHTVELPGESRIICCSIARESGPGRVLVFAPRDRDGSL